MMRDRPEMRDRPGLCGVLLALVAVIVVPEAHALSATDPWDAAAREAMPIYLKMWLGLMMLNNLAAIAFLKNHIPARWWFAGFIISHGIVVLMGMQELTVYAGQVSLFHILCWTPGAIALLLYRRKIRWPSAFAVWATLAAFFYSVSMIFDLRDAATWLLS